MAKWKMAGHMAVMMREAEKQAEQKRILEEQRIESIKNGKLLRKLGRSLTRAGCKAKADLVTTDRETAILKKDNINQAWDAHVANSDYFKRQDEHHRRLVMDNLRQMDVCSDEAKRIRQAIDLVCLKEKETDIEIFQTQKKLKTINWNLSNVHVVSAMKVAKRTEVAHQDYGLQLTENRRLVDQINHLEGERVKVQMFYDDLNRDLENLSKVMGGYVDEARTTYEQRDMNHRNMLKMQDHLEKSTAAYESDMHLLQFKIDVLRRMERFMTTKNKFRPDEGKERRRELRNQLSTVEKDAIRFSDIMDRIRYDLNEDDLQVIVKTFIELEEENYMLFKNISETRDICHTMQVEIEEIRDKIRKLRGGRRGKEEESIAKKIELLDKIEICQKETAVKEDYIAQADNVIRTYIKGILAILDKLGYTKEDIDRLAGVFKCIEERNIRVFLAEIERFVNQLHDVKTCADFLQWDKARRLTMTLMPAEPLPNRLTLVQRVVVVPPIHEEGDDIDDPALPTEAAFRPLDTLEMMQRVEEDLELRAAEDQMGVPVPSPAMVDPTSLSIGDSPQSPTRGKAILSVDVF